MLKTRVIGMVLVKSGIAVQSIGFKKYLPLGSPHIAINYLDRWGADEIVVLHIDAWRNKQAPTESEVKSYAAECQVPLSVGAGITQLTDIKKIIRSGADKVVMNTGLITYPEIITDASNLFGQQSIVISIDVKRQESGAVMGFINSGNKPTHATVLTLAKRAIELGAGEILINSIDQDGMKNGYDLDLIKSVVNEVNVPIIACGGAGHPAHLQMAIAHGASAVVAGNLFHFYEHSVVLVKQYLLAKNMAVRLDSDFTYQDFKLNDNGRLTKQSDSVLDSLRFKYIEEEVI